MRAAPRLDQRPRSSRTAIAATTLLPGPASTQLAIYCAWRLRGRRARLIGGACFILPGLVVILGLSVLLLSGHPPRLVLGAAAGAGAAVAAVAAQAAAGLIPASWRRAGTSQARRRPLDRLCRGGRGRGRCHRSLAGPGPARCRRGRGSGVAVPASAAASGRAVAACCGPARGIGGLAWTAFKVGALSYGGGFVIIPLMRSDAVDRHHWMTGSQFLYAVALGQITPGPVVQTVAVVGYAAAGLLGGVLAAVVAFAPSFVFVLAGGAHFDRLRANAVVRRSWPAPDRPRSAPSSAPPSCSASLTHLGNSGAVGAAIWLLVLRRGVVSALVAAGVVGFLAALAGLPVT